MARAIKTVVKKTGIISSAGAFQSDYNAEFYYGDTKGMGESVAKSSVGQVTDAIGRKFVTGSPVKWLQTTSEDLHAAHVWKETRSSGQFKTVVASPSASVLTFDMPNLGKCTIGACMVEGQDTESRQPLQVPVVVMTIKNAKGGALMNKQLKHLLEMGTFTELGFKKSFSDVLLAANTIAGDPLVAEITYKNDDGWSETKGQKVGVLQQQGTGHLHTLRRRRSGGYDRSRGGYKQKPDSIVKPWQRILDDPLLKKRSWGLSAIGSHTRIPIRPDTGYYAGKAPIWFTDVPDNLFDKLVEVANEIMLTCKQMSEENQDTIPANTIIEWAIPEILNNLTDPIRPASASRVGNSIQFNGSVGDTITGRKIQKAKELLTASHPSKVGVFDDLHTDFDKLTKERDRLTAIDTIHRAAVQKLITELHDKLTTESAQFIKDKIALEERIAKVVVDENTEYEKWLAGE